MTYPISLSTCYSCHKGFNRPSIPDNLVLTVSCCYNIFHTQCLSNWALKAGTCPTCRATVSPDQLGKSFEIVWKIFIVTWQHQPADIVSVFNALSKSEENDTECSICAKDFPTFPLSYLPVNQRLAHQTCAIPDLEKRDISVIDLARVAEKLDNKYSLFEKHLPAVR